MGEYILYYKNKIVGGIYDDRLLIKPVKSTISYMPNLVYEKTYENNKRYVISLRNEKFDRFIWNYI